MHQAVEHRFGVISDIGDHQLLSTVPMDDDPAIAADAVGTHMLELLPSDAAGGATAFEQPAIQDQRLRPVAQYQRNQDEAETKAHPADQLEVPEASSCAALKATAPMPPARTR